MHQVKPKLVLYLAALKMDNMGVNRIGSFEKAFISTGHLTCPVDFLPESFQLAGVSLQP